MRFAMWKPDEPVPVPEGITTEILVAMSNGKFKQREDGTPNPFDGFTSFEAAIWWWENVRRPVEVTKLMNMSP